MAYDPRLNLSDPPGNLGPMLNDRDRTALELAGATYRYPAIRETHAREQLGLDPVTFWARVNMLIDDPAAEAEMPEVVRRLRRIRDARTAARTAGRLRQDSNLRRTV